MSMREHDKARDNPMKDLRIGVFICDCGSNIAGHLDCKAVTEYATTLPGVVFAKENLYTCSEGGIGEIQKAIKENGLNRVLVASCSPRTHFPLFSGSCARAGMNPYLFEMVNIRDQCSWVHMGMREPATAKAMDLVRMGVAKAAFLEPQTDIVSPILPRVLVIGGGMAGLSAAQALAGMGLEVVLVEREPVLGGLLNSLHRLGPEGDLAKERIDAVVADVRSRPNVKLYLGATVKTVGGYIGNYEIGILSGSGEAVEEKVGCVVVATGAVPWVPQGLYGYDGKTVITQMDLEARLRAGETLPGRIVMIQCVGARSRERPYCARVCCVTAVKNAVHIKEAFPETHIHILYRDMQMYGTDKEQLLWKARGMGIRFDVYDPARPPQVERGGVTFPHALLGEDRRIACDLVVLSTPLVPQKDASGLSQLLRIAMDQNAYFLEAHAKLRPLDFATDGVFLCGSARYPATATEARSQGLGVASRVATILFKDKLVTSAIVAEIDPEHCVGCLGCLDMCPYGAIHYDPVRRVCEVNTVLCKGCGCCAATCPSQSASLKGFKPSQLLAQIRAM